MIDETITGKKARLAHLIGTGGEEAVQLLEELVEHQVDVITDSDWFSQKVAEVRGDSDAPEEHNP